MPLALLPRSPAAVFILLIALVLATTPPVFAAKTPATPPKSTPNAAAELQTLVFGLADRYAQGYAELLSTMANSPTLAPELRLEAQQEKVNNASMVYSLASSPSPEAALLDLMAFSFLRHLQLDRDLADRPDIQPEHKAALKAFATKVEAEIWTTGSRYVSPEQARSLRQLAESWFAENAGLRFSTMMEFHTFYIAKGDRVLGEVMRGESRGMLGPLRDAVASIDEARLVSERGVFLALRLPLLARWHAETLAYRALTLPESRELLNTADAMSTAATDMARQLDQLPAKLTEERRALLAGATDLTGQLGQVVADARAAVTAALPLAGDVRATGELARATAADVRTALDTLAAIQQTHAASAAGSATPEQILVALREARQTAEVSLQLVQALERAVVSSEAAGPSALTEALVASEASARRTIDHAAWRAMQVLGGAIALWGLVAWALGRRATAGK